jgi:hypothetical protein
VNVKAQGLLNAATWIEEHYGQAGLRDVIRACSPHIRDRYTSAIAIEWHPMSELVEFLEIAERLLGTGDGKLAEEIGAAGAKVNMRGSFARMLFYVAKPDFLMKRIAQLWSQFNDAGSMELISIDDYSSVIEVRAVPNPEWLFCCTLTGWAREVVSAMGGHDSKSRHTECRARGGQRCIWKQTWSGVSVKDAAEREVETASKRFRAADPVSPPKSVPPPPPSKKTDGE